MLSGVCNLACVAGMMLAATIGVFAIFVLRLPVTMGLSALVGGIALGALLLAALNRKLSSRLFVILLDYFDLCGFGLDGLSVGGVAWGGYLA